MHLTTKLFLFLASILAPTISLAQDPWIPPIGIPTPSFGITQSHTMYSGASGYLDAGNGPYTHYVDSTAANCSDAGNGTQAQPRCNIPLTLSAGAVVEIHGGPYTRVGGSDSLNFSCSGTSSQPVFVRGISKTNRPLIDGYKLDFTGNYCIVENLEVADGRIRLGGGTGTDSHLAARHNEVRNSTNGNMMSNSGANDVVIYDNHVHHNFRTPNDGHGFHVGLGSDRTWVVDNIMHHLSGDGIQFCHACSSDPPDHVYVGRNTAYSNRENGIDIKYASNVIISQNTVYNHINAPSGVEWCFDDNSFCSTWNSGSDGSSIVLGSDGGPDDVWVIFNEIYDSTRGIRNEDTFDAWIIGNVLHNISNHAIVLEKEGMPIHIIGNTIHGADIGIDQTFRNNFELFIHNNIFSNITTKPVLLESGEVSGASVMSNNLFWNNGSSITIEWNNEFTYANTAAMASFTGGTANIIADPLFVDAANNNFQLQSSSPAIDSGSTVLEAQNTTFQSVFGSGVTILADFQGKPRPQDGNNSSSAEYDMGAHEVGSVSGPGVTVPNAPANLRMKVSN